MLLEVLYFKFKRKGGLRLSSGEMYLKYLNRGDHLKRKFILTLAFVLLLAFATVPAFASENVQLQVNGDAVSPPCVSLVDSVSMIPLDTYAGLAGADVQWTSDSEFVITENGVNLSMTLGKKEASLDGVDLTLPLEPFKTNDGAFIPLRAVSEAFGFVVDWDGEQRLVTLTRSETRDGMTVSDLLAKSTEASKAYNTYAMEGLFKIDMDVRADGEAVGEAPQNMTSKLTGQIQNEPFSVYMKQTIDSNIVDPETGEKIPEMVMETFMNQEKMYMKLPEQEDWLVQDLPFSPEFWKQQQDIQSDPLKAAELMKEMGIFLNYGNDVTVNDTDYYVVNATLDMDKFKEGYQQILQQVMQGMSQDPASESPEDMQKQLMEVFENALIDYSYSVLINKETLISDIIYFDAQLQLTMEIPRDEEPDVSEPQEFKMNMKMKGDFTITDLGGPFKAPVVSNAKKLETPELETPELETPELETPPASNNE
jgi:hypothetical protein